MADKQAEYPDVCPGCGSGIDLRPGQWRCPVIDCRYYGWQNVEATPFERDMLGAAADLEVSRKDKRKDEFDMGLFIQANIDGLLVPLSKHAVTHPKNELEVYNRIESKCLALIASEIGGDTCVFELVAMLLHMASRYLRMSEGADQ